MARLSATCLVVMAIGLSFHFVTGCSPPPAIDSLAEEHFEGDNHEGHEHGHAAHGPHNGELIELGDEAYHAELVHDHATKTISVYLLDGSATKAAPIAAADVTLSVMVDGEEVDYKLPSVRDASDPAGQSSRFQITDEPLSEHLDAPESDGKLRVIVAGQELVGTIEHHEHE